MKVVIKLAARRFYLLLALTFTLSLMSQRLAVRAQEVAPAPAPAPAPTSKWVEMDGDEIESQLALYPNDEQETAGLMGPHMIFSDFCISTRDTIMGDMKQSLSGLVGGMFKLFLNSFEALGLDEKKVSQEAELSRRLESTPSGDSTSVSSGGVSGESPLAVQKQGGVGSFFLGAVVSAISAVGNTVGGVVLDRLRQMSSIFGLDKLQAALGSTCDRIGDYERGIRERFEIVRTEVGELNPDLAKVELEQLGCLTISRLLRVQGVCRVGHSIQQHPLLSLLLKSNNALQFISENRNILD